MNDGEYYDEDYSYEETESEPQGSGNLVKDLRNQLKSKTKAEKELRERLATMESQYRQTALKDALRDAGVNEKVAKLVPSDIAPDKVGEWLEEYGDVLGVQKNATPEPTAPAQSQDPEVQAMQAMQMMTASGSAPTGDITEADLSSAPSKEAFWELLRRGGNTKL
ncbi:hypothetical protein GCM10009550_01750 [Actinocorallia libanotica]|uniref:Scaffolding protein n=1 Tax=Actinocorallia libanotica TaxID=46162 RepID=A0ABN1Q1E3_9ACTN